MLHAVDIETFLDTSGQQLTVSPGSLPPGLYTVQVTVSDVDQRLAVAAGHFELAALPMPSVLAI